MSLVAANAIPAHEVHDLAVCPEPYRRAFAAPRIMPGKQSPLSQPRTILHHDPLDYPDEQTAVRLGRGLLFGVLIEVVALAGIVLYVVAKRLY